VATVFAVKAQLEPANATATSVTPHLIVAAASPIEPELSVKLIALSTVTLKCATIKVHATTP
jgi:hypothetical protein